MSTEDVLTCTNWKSLKHIYLKRVLLFVHNCSHGNSPVPLTELFNKRTPKYNLRQKMCFSLPRPRTEFLKKSLAYRGAILWNFLSNDIRAEDKVNSFKRKVTKGNVLDNFTLFD